MVPPDRPGGSGEQFAKFVELETAAIRIRQLQLNVVSGLLQTPDYAHALVKSYGNPDDVVERGVEIRMHRQSVLDPDGPEIFIILDESVLLPVQAQEHRARLRAPHTEAHASVTAWRRTERFPNGKHGGGTLAERRRGIAVREQRLEMLMPQVLHEVRGSRCHSRGERSGSADWS